MYEKEHVGDEGELKLTTKDILTSIAEESIDYKFALGFWTWCSTTGLHIAWLLT